MKVGFNLEDYPPESNTQIDENYAKCIFDTVADPGFGQGGAPAWVRPILLT